MSIFFNISYTKNLIAIFFLLKDELFLLKLMIIIMNIFLSI